MVHVEIVPMAKSQNVPDLEQIMESSSTGACAGNGSFLSSNIEIKRNGNW